MNDSQLISMAFDAMNYSYSPYSGYKVGAALLTAEGKVYTGCNIENAAFGPTNCAERTAIFKAVSEGERNFVRIAVVGGKDGSPDDYFYPCGVCRQVMAEFCNKDFEIITAKTVDDFVKVTLGELLPYGFGPEKIK